MDNIYECWMEYVNPGKWNNMELFTVGLHFYTFRLVNMSFSIIAEFCNEKYSLFAVPYVWMAPQIPHFFGLLFNFLCLRNISTFFKRLFQLNSLWRRGVISQDIIIEILQKEILLLFCIFFFLKIFKIKLLSFMTIGMNTLNKIESDPWYP